MITKGAQQTTTETTTRARDQLEGNRSKTNQSRNVTKVAHEPRRSDRRERAIHSSPGKQNNKILKSTESITIAQLPTPTTRQSSCHTDCRLASFIFSFALSRSLRIFPTLFSCSCLFSSSCFLSFFALVLFCFLFLFFLFFCFSLSHTHTLN